MSKTEISEIDRKIAEAKARQEAQGKETGVDETTVTTPIRQRKPRLTKEERDARDKAKAEEKERKAAERAAKRAAKQAEKEANKKPAHMAKIEKALAALPELREEVTEKLAALVQDIPLDQLDVMADHIKAHVRVERTKAALERSLEVGQVVKIVSGDNRYVGKTATVVKAQRIRCYVNVEGVKNDIYLFTSDVEPLDESDAETIAIDEVEEAVTEG